MAEKIKRVKLGDPRSGGQTAFDIVNRHIQGYSKAPVRQWDDSPSQMAKKRSAGKGKKK